MPDVIDYAERIAWYDDKISRQIESFEALGDILSEMEKRVKLTTLEWVQSNPDLAKKLGMERAEMYAAITPQQKSDYYEVCNLRNKAKFAEKIMAATQAGMSGVQSMMKYCGKV